MVVHYHAIFVGKKPVAPYKPRHAYNIEVKHHLFGRISVQPLHGYANIKLFLHVWQIKGYIDPETGAIKPA